MAFLKDLALKVQSMSMNMFSAQLSSNIEFPSLMIVIILPLIPSL